jgi:hypothetical protein
MRTIETRKDNVDLAPKIVTKSDKILGQMAKTKWGLSPLKERVAVVKAIVEDKELLRSYPKGYGVPPCFMQMEVDRYLLHGEDGLKVIRRSYSKQEKILRHQEDEG